MEALILPLTAFLLFATQPPRYGTSFSRIDPQQTRLNYTHLEHAAGSLLLTHLTERGLKKLGLSQRKARFWAPSIAFAVGCIKETWDASQWEERAGEGWDPTDLVADLLGVGLGHLTYDHQSIDAFCLPAALGPTIYERVGNRRTAVLSSTLLSLSIQPPVGKHRSSRLIAATGGSITGYLATYLEPKWTFDREYWMERLNRR